MTGEPGVRRGAGTILAALGLAALLAALLVMTARLALSPGLHGDEAWAGLRAHENMGRGFFTLHGMNLYTGALHAWVVSLVYRAAGVGVFGLRAVSVACNAGALVVLFVHLLRSRGPASALLLALLHGSSLMLLLYARVGWETCAFGFLLAAVLLVCAHAMLARGRFRPPVLLAYLAATVAGAYNHFIFIMLPLALLGCSLLVAASRPGSPRAWRFLLLCGVSLLVTALLVQLKVLVPEDAPAPVVRAAAAAIAALPLAGLLLFRACEKGCAALWRRFPSAASRLSRAAGRARPFLLVFLLLLAGAGVARFLADRWGGFWGVLSSGLVAVRLFSTPLPLPVAAAAGLLAALLLVLHLWAAVGSALRAVRGEETEHSLFAALLPAVYAAVFSVVIGGSSLRYFLLLLFLLVYSSAAALPRLLGARALAAVVIVALAGAAAVQAFAWGRLHAPPPHRAVAFRVGEMTETSAHFLPTDGLYRRLKARGACSYEAATQDEGFITEPLWLYNVADPEGCAGKRTARVRYCGTCADPPGFLVTVR